MLRAANLIHRLTFLLLNFSACHTTSHFPFLPFMWPSQMPQPRPWPSSWPCTQPSLWCCPQGPWGVESRGLSSLPPLLYPLYSPFFSSLIMLGSDLLHQEGENHGSNIITKIIIVITLMVSPVSLGAFVVTITSHLLAEHVHPFVEQTRLLLCG